MLLHNNNNFAVFILGHNGDNHIFINYNYKLLAKIYLTFIQIIFFKYFSRKIVFFIIADKLEIRLTL